MQYTARYSSHIKATPAQAWAWMTSVESISKEMSPILRMTMPAGVKDLQSISFESGKPLFRSWFLLFKILPFDFSDFTLEKIEPEISFVEQSTMGSMRSWRHERRVEPANGGCLLIDELTFEPRFAGWLANKFVRIFFSHRHRQLLKYLGRAEMA